MNTTMHNEFKLIQRGAFCGTCITPAEANNLAEQSGICLPHGENNMPHRQIKNDKWNRNLCEDFSNFETIRCCVLFCLANYRADDDKREKSTILYEEILKIPYESMFEDNLQKVWDTLVAWNMNTRGAKLVPFDVFSKSLHDNKFILDELNQYSISNFCDKSSATKIKNLLINVYKKLKLSKSNPFVTTSKTLHFFLPQLFIPLDRTYTVSYFTNYSGTDLPPKEKTEDLVTWAISFHKQLAELYLLYKDEFMELSIITKIPVTKLLDNMLIGFTMYRRYYCQQFNPKQHILYLTAKME